MDTSSMSDMNAKQELNGSIQNEQSSFGNNNPGSQQNQSQQQAMDVSGSNTQNGANGQNDPNNQGQKRQAEFDSNANANNKQGMQKRMRTDNYNQNKNGGSFPNRAGKVDLRILLPSKDAGAIIGRGGANIKKLRSEHKTIIQVPDCDGPERLLLIGGDTEAAISTILDIIPLLEEVNQKFGNNEHPTEFRLLVHQSQAGCIIGRSGDKIKELRQSHNLDMKVYSECAPMSTERIAQMRGKPQDIVNCLREVLTLLESAPPKGMNRPYDPHNFNEFLSSQYGGYTSDKRNNMGGRNNQGGGGGGNFGNNQGGGPGGNMQRNGPRGNNQGGFFGNNNNNMNDRRGGNMGGNRGNNMGNNNNMGNRGPGGMNNRGGNMGGNMGGGNMGGGNMGGNNPQNRRSNSAGGGPGGMGGGNRGGPMGNQGNRPGMGNQGNRGNFGNRPNNQGGPGNQGGFNNGGMNNQQSFNNNQNNNASAITNQVTIPNDLAGAIIGPKGSKIAQIRDQSGAGITIDKPTPGSNDRIITITGSAEQIQNAQYLLQMTVKQSGLWQG